MQNYYEILQVKPDASLDEIKRSFRKLAMVHHPDKGGDQEKFKEINTAYDILSNPQKRQQYDLERSGVRRPQGRGPGFGFNFEEIFTNSGPFGPGFNEFFHAKPQRNRDLNIRCQISFLDSYNGKQLEANFAGPDGKRRTVHIDIPPGIQHGEVIRFNGLGDDSIPNLPKGNLNVNILVETNEQFKRVQDDLYTTCEISPIEAIIGCTKNIQTITGESNILTIKPGITHGTEYAKANLGFTNIRTKHRGRFVIVVLIKSMIIDDPETIKLLTEINEKFK